FKRYINTMLQFVGGNPDYGFFNRIQFFWQAPQIRFNFAVQFIDPCHHLAMQFLKISHIDLGHIIGRGHMQFDRLSRVTGHLPGQHCLQSQLSGIMSCRRFSRYSPAIYAMTLTISSAPSAASTPLLPALVPELSIACSILSVVITPKETGIPYSRETW